MLNVCLCASWQERTHTHKLRCTYTVKHLAQPLICIEYINTHLTVFAAASHVMFLRFSIQRKKRCHVVQNQSPLFSCCSQHPPFVTPWSGSLFFFFFSCWVFMTGRLGAVIPALYTTWHCAAVRPQRTWLDGDMVVMVSSAPSRKWRFSNQSVKSKWRKRK